MKKRLKKSIYILFFPVVMILLLGPLEIYCGNISAFKFTWRDFLPFYVIISVAVLVIGGVIMSLFKDKIHNVLCFIVFSFSLIAYIQNLFLNGVLIDSSGGSMRWDTMKTTMYINLAIWVVLFAAMVLVFVKKRKIYDIVEKYGSICLSAIQLITVVVFAIQAIGAEKDVEKELSYAFVGDTQLEVASKDNVIVIILDCTGNTQIEYATQKYPELLEPLNDFTRYTNADSGYCATFPSMTHMFTGIEFDLTDESCVDWLERAWTSDNAKNFYETVHNSGYNFNMYTNDGIDVYGDMENMLGMIDNVGKQDVSIEYKMLYTRLTKLSLYKYAPYIIKPRLEVPGYLFSYVYSYSNGHPAEYNNGEFYEMLKNDGLYVGDNEKSITVQHFRGGHPDYRNLADGTPCAENGSNLSDALQGVMVMLDEYLNQLKELGLYDDSTIIITADHGIYRLDAWIGESEAVWDLQPVFFVKKAGEKHDEMIINEAPISACDLMPTLLEIIGEDYTEFGTSIWDWNEGDQRERVLMHNDTVKGYHDARGFRNAWGQYIYTGTGEDLEKTSEDGPDNVIQAIDWK